MTTRHVQAVNARDLIANLRGFTDDIVYLPPDGPEIQGKEELPGLVVAAFDAFEPKIR